MSLKLALVVGNILENQSTAWMLLQVKLAVLNRLPGPLHLSDRYFLKMAVGVQVPESEYLSK